MAADRPQRPRIPRIRQIGADRSGRQRQPVLDPSELRKEFRVRANEPVIPVDPPDPPRPRSIPANQWTTTVLTDALVAVSDRRGPVVGCKS